MTPGSLLALAEELEPLLRHDLPERPQDRRVPRGRAARPLLDRLEVDRPVERRLEDGHVRRVPWGEDVNGMRPRVPHDQIE